MLDTLLALANTKGGASFMGGMASGLTQPDPTTAISGGVQFDSRGFLDGSGWTVSTGKASATGATQTRTGDPFGETSLGAAPQSVTQAGTSMLLGLVLVGVAAAMILKRG